MADVTHLLEAAVAGDRRAAADLLPLVYDELRKLAAVRMATESPDHTLQATALVHEAYLRLIGAPPPAAFAHRGHFFAAAAEAMRRILVEAARRKKRHKHGGERPRVELVDVASRDPDDRLLALDVELRHFTGAGHDAIATALGMTVYAVRQKWTYARAWLRAAMSDDF
jgi:RNA polymerase sigma factor (TIGR02999 family)